jgi:predicted HTH transcriptional regulator
MKIKVVVIMRWKDLKNNNEIVEENKQKNNEDIQLALAIYELSKQIEDNNRLIKTLIQKIEILELRLNNKNAYENEFVISEIDEKIIELIKKMGKVTAEEIKNAFNYKGKNAASARLNNLCKIGLLKKVHGGKKVYFMLNERNNVKKVENYSDSYFYKDI